MRVGARLFERLEQGVGCLQGHAVGIDDDRNLRAPFVGGQEQALAKIANVIDGIITHPKRRDGRPNAVKEFRLFLARLIFFVEKRHNLKPTRNASSPAVSACDAVSVAMNTLPAASGLKPNSFSELAKIYSEAEKSGAFVS